MRRVAIVTVLAGVLVAAPTMTALAHECFVVNKSAAGSENSAHSENWFYVTTDDIIGFVTGDPNLVAALSAPFREAVEAAGLPTELAIFNNHTLGTSGPNKDTLTPSYSEQGHSNDGRGVDHVFSGGYLDQYVAILLGLLGA
jgi:hypothetical protein